MDDRKYRARLIAKGILMALVSVPLILKVIPPNALYGFRSADTLRSRDVWYLANSFAGWALLASSAMGSVLLLILPSSTKRWQLLAAFLVPLVGAFVASLEYVARLH